MSFSSAPLIAVLAGPGAAGFVMDFGIDASRDAGFGMEKPPARLLGYYIDADTNQGEEKETSETEDLMLGVDSGPSTRAHDCETPLLFCGCP